MHFNSQNQIQFTQNEKPGLYVFQKWYSFSLLFVVYELFIVMRRKGRKYRSLKMITTNNNTDPHNLLFFSKCGFLHVQGIDGFQLELSSRM